MSVASSRPRTTRPAEGHLQFLSGGRGPGCEPPWSTSGPSMKSPRCSHWVPPSGDPIISGLRDCAAEEERPRRASGHNHGWGDQPGPHFPYWNPVDQAGAFSFAGEGRNVIIAQCLDNACEPLQWTHPARPRPIAGSCTARPLQLDRRCCASKPLSPTN
jgi:hypothetical protein